MSRTSHRIGPSSAPGLRATTEAGWVIDDPSPDRIAELVASRGPNDTFVIIDRLVEPPIGHHYAQARREADDRWVVEYRAGGPLDHYRTTVPDRCIVTAILVGWAFDLPGWRARAAWEPLHLGR